MFDWGRIQEDEAHPAVRTHPGYARTAAGDWCIHTDHWGLQVDQTQVRLGCIKIQFKLEFKYL